MRSKAFPLELDHLKNWWESPLTAPGDRVNASVVERSHLHLENGAKKPIQPQTVKEGTRRGRGNRQTFTRRVHVSGLSFSCVIEVYNLLSPLF